MALVVPATSRASGVRPRLTLDQRADGRQHLLGPGEESWQVPEIDVGAHAARMQRTLIEMGFVPAAYVPAMAFHNVERIDVVRMMKLVCPLEHEDVELAESAASQWTEATR